ncbi:MAG: mandelate racemase/muconate lactonizing enzyme family protein [Planctomycetota bacterium]|nr:MAG: mandelate racemase/muconate lactonizing enzyme family protein [Planctomycetota bacterium]REK24730.1 MAG: mandelate racemase/muconate lactonizing enzyme family protein [Planctomycetota bacterium]REK30001.1 MAG: mandelate racemase/muconate lactonizing enzyme family protein [Planctomycetota bacterium]
MALAGGLCAPFASSRADDGEETAADSAGLRRMRIGSVETFLLRHQLERPFGASVSVPLSKTRETLLVRIETEDGLVGWGESAPISGARGTIDDHLGPQLIGRNPMEYRRLWRELWGPNFGNALAVGAIETALNDLRGKALGLPVAELFGGRLRDQVPVYVSALAYVEGREIEDEYPEVAAQMVECGHRAIKMRLGRYDVEREAKVAEQVRKTVGPDVKLMADGNGAYTIGSALEMAHALDELDFEFFEEPLPQSPHYAGYAELRTKMPLPLAGGEVLDSRATARELIEDRAIDIIQPDLSLCGGLCEALFIAEMAALSRIRCIPHCWGGDVLIAASVHLLSLLPDPHWGLPTDTPLLELDQSENPWRDGLAIEPLTAEEGKITVPERPGLGIEVDLDVVRDYAV